MAETLTGKTPKDTYTWLLQAQAGGPLHPETARVIALGDGTETPLGMTQTEMMVSGQVVMHAGNLLGHEEPVDWPAGVLTFVAPGDEEPSLDGDWIEFDVNGDELERWTFREEADPDELEIQIVESDWTQTILQWAEKINRLGTTFRAYFYVDGEDRPVLLVRPRITGNSFALTSNNYAGVLLTHELPTEALDEGTEPPAFFRTVGGFLYVQDEFGAWRKIALIDPAPEISYANQQQDLRWIGPQHGWTANSVVNGSSTIVTASGVALQVATSTTANSEAYIRLGGFLSQVFVPPGSPMNGAGGGINWNRKFAVGWSHYLTHGSGSAPVSTTEGWIRIGHARTLATYGAPSTASVGVHLEGGFIWPFVHNGTTLNEGVSAIYSTSSADSPVVRVQIVRIAAGIFQFWVNGVLMATLEGGPTGTSGADNTGISVSLKNPAGGAGTNGTLHIVNGNFLVGYLP